MPVCSTRFSAGWCGLVRDFPLTALGWILDGCVRSVEPELQAPESGPPASQASGRVVVCYLLTVLIVNRLRHGHRLAAGALRPPFNAGYFATARRKGYV
jgi:hypothetical protein